MADEKKTGLEKLKAAEPAVVEKTQREAELEAQIATLQDQLKARDESTTRAVRPSEKVTTGEDPYRFEVGPTSPKHKGVLPTKTVTCCDESEAIRWYCVTVADPSNPAKQVDPVVYPISAKCLDEDKRQKRIHSAKYLAMIRSKAEAGNPLTDAEQALLVANL